MSTKQQISTLAGALTAHQKKFAQMSVEDRQWVIGNTETAIALFAKAVKNRPKEAKLLEYIGFFQLPAIKKFVTAEKFREGKTTDGVRIAFINYKFRTHFLPIVEENVYAMRMRNQKLCRNSLDTPIVTEIGGEEKAQTHLAQIWELLKRQGTGKPLECGLLVNGNANIFYVRDINGVLCAVSANWSDFIDCWSVETLPVSISREWCADSQVISH